MEWASFILVDSEVHDEPICSGNSMNSESGMLQHKRDLSIDKWDHAINRMISRNYYIYSTKYNSILVGESFLILRSKALSYLID